jgi:hypothetical protein
MFLPALPAAATQHYYAIEILTVNGQPTSSPPESFTIPVSIAGDCWATSFVGQISQYGVQVEWGDGSVVDIVPNLTQAGGNFTGTWGPVSHSYFPSGTYTIIATLYHQMYPGAERSPDATFSMTLTVTFAGSNSPICQGATIQLTGRPDGMSSYAWTGPNGFTSGLQNPSIPNATPTMSGTYTLTITSTTGATDTSTTNVIVNPLPDSTITTPSAVCAESTGHTASVPDAGPGASYSWSVTGQGILTGVSDARTIAWNALGAGTATISVTVTSLFGCTITSSTNVMVSPELVATASSNSPVYEDGTISLFGPASMASYSWTGPNGFTSSVQNPSIPNATLAMAGTYILTVISTSGCTDTTSTDIVVNAKPVAAASNSSPVCEDGTINLFGGPSGMASYSWTGPNGFTSNVQNPTISIATPGMTGTYTLTVTYSPSSTGTATTDVLVNAKPAATASSNSPVCEGSTISLSGSPSGMASYSWTGPNGFTSDVQNPSIPNANLDMAGTYTLTVTSTSGCTGPAASTTVVVNAKPVATADSNSPVCEGSTISLFGPAGISSYSWTGPNGFTSDVQNPSIPNATLAMAGAYTLTVISSSGCTGPAASIIVVVNPKPVATASSNSPVCEGSTIYLSGGPAGMASYSWTGPNGFTSDVQNPTIPDATLDMAGTYTLTVISTSGCTGPAASTTVVVNAKPVTTASSNSPVCEGSTISLSGGPAGMASYSWTGPNGFTSDVQNPTIPDATLDMAGTYTLTLISTSGCTGLAASTTVVVNAKPVATADSNSPVCEGSTIYLSGGPAGMASYSWTGPNGFTSDVQNPSIPDATLDMAGTYTLTLISTSGCTGLAASTTVVVNAKPVATADSNSPVCEGSTIYLSGGPAGMASYSWTGPNGFTSDVQNPSIPNATLAMAGAYTLTVISSGCTGPAASTTVVVNAKPVATASSNSPVCEGSTIYLSGGPSGMASYSWTGPNGFTSDVQNPSIPNANLDMAGTYTLTVTNTSGCTGLAASTTVVVNAKPVATADSNSPVCEGSTILLFGPAGMASYSWTGPNGFTSNVQNLSIPNATLAMAGAYTLTVISSSGCTGPAASIIVVVNPKPVATASSNSPVCEGSTILLFGPAGMASYSWTGPNGFTSDLQNPTILNATLDMAGTYILTVISTSGCTGPAASTSVVVNAKPVATAGSNSPVYETYTIYLSGGPAGMASYSWTGPNSFTSSVQNPSIPDAALNMSGTYTLTVTNSSGCTGTITTNVTVLQLPIPSAPTLISLSNGTYGEGTSITYTWNSSEWGTNYKLTVSTSSNPLDTSKFKFNAELGNVTQYTDTGYPNNGTIYHWWVSAANIRGWAAQSQVNANGFTFINWPPPPSAPALVSPGTPPAGQQSPGNGTYIPGTSITYQWNASARATSYYLLVSTSSDSSDTSKYKFAAEVGNVTQFTGTNYPDNRTTYYWWVNAGNIAGWAPSSQWSANGLSFINGTQLPEAPTLVSPGNGTVVSGTSITYHWNASARATNYYLLISTSSNSSDTSKFKYAAEVGNVTQFTDTNYPNNGNTYYWWVNAGNSGDWPTSSEWIPNGFSFVNYTPPPLPPTLVYPGNGTSISGTSITYRWNASATATNYYLLVSTSGNSSDTSKYKSANYVGNVTQFTNTNYPNNGNTYYWWVNAYNTGGGWAPESQWVANGFSFVNYTPPPLPPTLVYPGNGTSISGTSITYRWNASATATNYYLLVSTSGNSSDTSKYKSANYVGNVTQFTNTNYPNNGNTYYWWVNAYNTGGGWAPESQWVANGFSFVNYTPPPLPPTLVYPGNGTSISGTSITYRWNASATATNYYLLVSTSGNSSDTSKYKFANYVGNVTQFTNTNYPNNGTTYYWWVNAYNSGGGWAPESQWVANGFWFINRP